MSVTPFHTRNDWGARAPKATPSRIDSEGLTAHYAGDSPWPASADRSSGARFAATTDHNRCAPIVRGFQAFHMDGRGWNDGAYNSLVCPHSHRYEMRGPGNRSGANGTNPGNARSEAICYIAGGDDPLTDGAKLAFHDEAQRFRKALWRQHSDWKSTACAGPSIKQWQANGWPRPDSPEGDPFAMLTNEQQTDLYNKVIGIDRWIMPFQAQINDMDEDADVIRGQMLGYGLEKWQDTFNVPDMLREDRTARATDAAKRDGQHDDLMKALTVLTDAVKALAPAEPTA